MSAPRRRLLFLSPLPPPTGGIPTWTLGVLAGPLGERYEMQVVNTSPSQKTTVHQHSRLRADRVFDALRILGRLVVALVRFRPHVVHINTPYFWAFFRDGLAVWLATAFGARTVLHFRGGDFPEFVEAAAPWLQRGIDATLRRCTRLIALTRHTERFLVDRIGAKQVRYVPNFIRFQDVGPLADRQGRTDERALEVVFVGWILEGKGVRELLQAARALPNLRFTLVGPVQPEFVEDIRSELEAEAQHVELLPALPRDEVMALYRRADLFVLPTHREGFPNVVLEAMAAGLPIVSTPVGAIPEAVRDGEEGLLVPVRDGEALAAALGRLAEDRMLRLSMGARARERVESRFSLEAVSADLDRVYAECLGQP